MIIDEDEIFHIGTPRHSGRYPWGSGGDENTHPRNESFLDQVKSLKRQGMTDKEIADGFGMTILELRAEKSIQRNAKVAARNAMIDRLAEKGNSPTAISDRMQIPASTVRSVLAKSAEDRQNALQATADKIKAEVDSLKPNTVLDVGSGTEINLGVSETRKDIAVQMLKKEGYGVYTFPEYQAGTGLKTKYKVVTPPGMTQKQAWENRGNLQQITGVISKDGGRTFPKLQEPLSIHPDRLQIKYKEDGGGEADGVVYVRPGVKDLSMGGNNYGQVRIKIGDDHYIKGMAMLKDDLPDGVDLQFNTNKSSTGNKLDALKKLDKEHPELPFGTITDQIGENIGTPHAKVTSAMNMVNEKGDWEKWNKTLSSQMLSKQNRALVKSQLDLTYENRVIQYNEIKSLTNPVVRQRLLHDFAESTDSAAVQLKAAAMPRQQTHVILPLTKIKPTEVYAPNFKNGETVVLIRHPHAGPFEIPELTVNNKNAEGRKLIGTGERVDAIGIHHSVAQRLSGADFDGDAVTVIPNNERRIKAKPALEGILDFDPKRAYPGYPGMKPMKNKQAEMGKISNLITDMSLRGAPSEHLARAVKHSMVVIDAKDHNLNWKQSAIDHNIKDLKAKYQTGGASTLISRARADLYVDQRKPRRRSRGGPIDVETGEKKWEPTGKINKKTGKPVQTHTTRLAEAKDAFTLMSSPAGHPNERLYAEHSNKLKAMANQARLEAIRTPSPRYSPSAKKTYSNEVESLNAKLTLAKSNRPKERQAQAIVGAVMRAKINANPNMEKETIRKLRFQTLADARNRTGAGKERIKITDKEWEAIQHGAISKSKLIDILNNADMKRVHELAAPKKQRLMTSSNISRAKSRLALGYTLPEVAEILGVSLSTLKEGLKEGG